jgi:polysaccharide deacetylase family protein (PEP-CTERM system associated)
VEITPLRTPGRAPRVLTIDAEDWFHVCGDAYYSDWRRWDRFLPRVEATLTALFDRLAPGGHRATVFFLGWVARRYPDLVREAVARGHEAGVHGDLHRRADEMTAAEFRDDLARARDVIEKASGRDVSTHRAAEWSVRHPADPTLALLAEAGIARDASVVPVPPLGRADAPAGPYRVETAAGAVVELPPLTGHAFLRRVPIGGGWAFRTAQESRILEAEAAFRERGWPAIYTLHPWELDPEHPAMPGLAPFYKLVHFAGLPRLSARLDRWLAGERFVALSQAAEFLMPA